MSGPAQTPWAGKYLEVRVEGTWEYAVRARDIAAAVIVAIDGDAVLLVEQHRVPLGRSALEFPAGLVGDEIEGERIEEAAGRELEEETGYRAASLRSLGLFASSPGMTSETFTLVLATGLEKIGAGGGVAGEDILVHRVPLGDLAGFVEAKRAQGVAIDARLVMLLGPIFLSGAVATGS